MKLIQSIFLICLILFANLNLFVYQNWCHGENIGYTVNSKRFEISLKTSDTSQKIPSFKRDYCCKDILIKSNENSFFSAEKTLQLAYFSPIVLLADFNWNLSFLNLPQKVKISSLFPNPPPIADKLYQFYCRYTFYG